MASKRPSQNIRRRAIDNAQKAPPHIRDLRWWKDPEPHKAIWDNYKRIGNRTRAMRARDMYYACLYDDAQLASAMQSLGAIGEFTPQTMATNIIRRQVDTFVAKIGKNRPLPMGLTKGGNYAEQRRAKGLTQYFEGVLDLVGFWPTRMLRLRDAGIFGSGVALNYRVGRKFHHDRLFRREVRVCPIDAERGKPRTLYIGRLVDKLILAERFPEQAEQIYSADSHCDELNWTSHLEEDAAHLALVVEAFHLPSSPTSDDGAHAIAVSNATLATGQFMRELFPLSKYDYSPPVAGYFGTGIAAQLEGLQYEVNSVGLRLQERQYLMGTYVLRQADSDVTYETIDNGTMTEVVWAGSKPEFVTPPAAHPDLFNWWRELRTQMPGELTGQSGMSTRSEKPAGLNSGRALRTYHEIDSENLTAQGRADEEDVIATCWQFFDLAEEIYAETGKEVEGSEPQDRGAYVVRVESRSQGRSVLDEIDYGQVRLDREAFKLRTFPTNFLRGTPEAQMQTINEMMEIGLLTPEEIPGLLDFPDLQRVLDQRGAPRRLIEKILDRIKSADDPESAYVYPEPAMGLELCKVLGQLAYIEAKIDGVDQKNLKMLLQFSLDAIAEEESAKAKEQAAQAPPQEGELYAPPEQMPMPEGAVAPEVMPEIPPIG